MISVVIVNYNTLDLTANCIASIIENVKGIDFEIIVVDNASTMDNPQMLKQRFPSINLVCNDVNLGFAKGNNIGISVSIGEEIGRLQKISMEESVRRADECYADDDEKVN